MVSTAGEGTWRDTAQDKLVRTILSALAEYERKVIAARTSAAMLRHQANGRRMSFLVPVGWRQDPNKPARLIEDPDEQGTLEYNYALGQRRAEAAKSFLVSRGVDADKIRTISKGEEEPAVFESEDTFHRAVYSPSARFAAHTRPSKIGSR